MDHRAHQNSHVRHHMHDVGKEAATHTQSAPHGIGHGHDKHAGHHTGDFLRRFLICLLLTIPILLLSHMIQDWLGFTWRFSGDRYVLASVSTLVYFYGGWPFLVGAIRELQNRAIGMMTLVALAISVAYFYSLAVVLGLKGMDFFWELATLIDIMLLGHWLEMKSVMAASKALESLVALLPTMVYVEKDGQPKEVPLQELRNGDVMLIKPGEKIAADGRVLGGSSFVNESMLTGESQPQKRAAGDRVIGGSLNGDGSMRIQATGTGKDSYLNKVITLVQSAQRTKSNTQNLADTVAKWLTIVSILVGIVTFLYWYRAGHDLPFALERLVTVMVTSCPHALGVAIPLVAAISTAKAAVGGLLIRNRTAFEGARKITMVIFDKTGTLTKGAHEVQRVISIDPGYSRDELLQYASAVQQHSEHYIGQGILRKLKDQGLDLWKSDGFQYTQGVGVSARVDGKEVMAVGPNYFRKEEQPLPPIPNEIDQESETLIHIILDGKLAGFITLADSIRDSATQAIRELKAMNIKSFLLTGDNEQVAASVAGKLDMNGYLANVLPHEKQDKVKEFQAKGEVVAMAGDGVNDAPALAQADVGIAVGSGTDVAVETADIILVNSDPAGVVQIISFGRATYRKMVQNLFWAVGYNVLAIPLAAGVLFPWFILSPAMGAVLMSLSTIIVAVNAQLLRKGLSVETQPNQNRK